MIKNWFDESLIYIQSGDGGRGCESYNHRTDRKKEPNGGNGGKGGDVWIEIDANMTGLLHYKFSQHFQAESGAFGSSGNKAGRVGNDLVLKVPLGTTLINGSNGLRIRDLKNPGDRVMVARGGRGGAGNHTGKPAGMGTPGEKVQVKLDLKIQADIFIVGTPGSGKSALLSRLTNAQHNDKGYAFSTTAPHLGVYKFDNYSEAVICELPSLMEGSNQGHGLGNRYLKHLDRSKIIWLVLEPKSNFAESINGAYDLLRREIEAFDSSFLSRPYICLINKADLIETGGERQEIEKTAEKWGCPLFFISVKTGEGIDRLMKFYQGGSYYG